MSNNEFLLEHELKGSKLEVVSNKSNNNNSSATNKKSMLLNTQDNKHNLNDIQLENISEESAKQQTFDDQEEELKLNQPRQH